MNKFPGSVSDSIYMNKFPGSAKFAFSIFDDTDLSTVENIGPIYNLLSEIGLRTTKSVWPLASVAGAQLGGASLQNPEYLAFVLGLKRTGFEIALHSVRNTCSTRSEVETGLDEFRRLIGQYPRVHTNHAGNRENLYWGPARFSTVAPFYRAMTPLQHRQFEGHIENSSYFWGDLCRQRIDYVRNFVFREINLDRINPTMPYHDEQRPFVNMWFSSSDAPDSSSFCELLSEANQDRLEEEHGFCIVYTHLASGFLNDGIVNPRIEYLLRRLAGKNGWFVPVSTLLDFLRQQRKTGSISRAELDAMEREWLMDRMTGAVKHAMRKWLARTGAKDMAPQHNHKRLPSARVVHVTSVHAGCDVRIFVKECQSLARAGYEVIELTNDPKDTNYDGVKIRGLGRNRGRLHRVTIKLLRMAREAFRLNGDIYHIHDPELLLLGLMLRAFSKRVIYDVHEDLPSTVLYKHYIPARIRGPLRALVDFLEAAAARRMSGLVTATPAIAERFRNFNRNCVVVSNFPHVSELAPVRPQPWAQRSMSVAYIGGIAEERGIRELLAAMGYLPKSLRAQLELAGWFSDQGLYPELQQLPEWTSVKWRGLLDRPQVAELLSSVRAGLVVLHPEPNFLTSQPIKLFEYMAAGIPVVASDFPLWRDIIRGWGCGIGVDPGDPSAIAEGIHYLLTHDAEAEAMGCRGRQAVEEQFNWSREECKLLAFYNAMTAAPQSGNGVVLGTNHVIPKETSTIL
jgi:glycosyltransferase involved in cell wall biosynthesis